MPSASVQATTEYPLTATTSPVILNVTANGQSFNVSADPLVMTLMETRLSQRVSMMMEIRVNSDGEVDLAVYGRQNSPPTHTRYDFTRPLASKWELQNRTCL